MTKFIFNEVEMNFDTKFSFRSLLIQSLLKIFNQLNSTLTPKLHSFHHSRLTLKLLISRYIQKLYNRVNAGTKIVSLQKTTLFTRYFNYSKKTKKKKIFKFEIHVTRRAG